MRSNLQYHRWLIIVASLTVSMVLAGENLSVGLTNSLPAVDADSDNNSATNQKQLSCLPKDVRADEIVTFDMRGGQRNLDVQHVLRNLKARCRKGKLVDGKRREIRFFRPSCWGNPPSDYREISRNENTELANLRKHYTVVVFGCSPAIQ